MGGDGTGDGCVIQLESPLLLVSEYSDGGGSDGAVENGRVDGGRVLAGRVEVGRDARSSV